MRLYPHSWCILPRICGFTEAASSSKKRTHEHIQLCAAEAQAAAEIEQQRIAHEAAQAAEAERQALLQAQAEEAEAMRLFQSQQREVQAAAQAPEAVNVHSIADSSDEVASTDLAHAITLHTFQEVRGPAVCGSPGARAAVGGNSLASANMRHCLAG